MRTLKLPYFYGHEAEQYSFYRIPKQLMSYVSDKPPGHGLIKVGGAIVPLVNEFPKDTSLYWLMTTKPGEG